MAVVKRKPNPFSPRSINAMLVGYIRHDHKDAPCNRKGVAATERKLSSDKVEGQMSVNWRLNKNLFHDNLVQDQQSDRDAMDAREEVSESSVVDSNICEQSQVEEYKG
jgi:hypothetical protein